VVPVCTATFIDIVEVFIALSYYNDLTGVEVRVAEEYDFFPLFGDRHTREDNVELIGLQSGDQPVKREVDDP